MTKHYTELTGASADRIQFGAPIFAADQHFRGAAPSVVIGLARYTLVSISTLGCRIRAQSSVQSLSEVVDMGFEQSGETLISVRAVVLDPDDDGVHECQFFDRALDLDALTSANARAVALNRTGITVHEKVAVPSAYKVFCADLVDFLATVRRQLEADLGPFTGDLDADEQAALDREMEQSIADRWAALTVEANRLVLPFKDDKPALAKIKQYTENVLTPILCEGPLWNRSYTKPLGYPGDYQIMNAFYNRTIIGDEPYTRLLGVLGLLSGAPVVTRMSRLVQEIKELRAKNPTQEHFHMMSIGAGPARELQEFFASGEAEGAGYAFTLVDPEVEALEYAIHNVYKAVKNDLSSVIVSGMNTSFTEMLRPTKTFRHLPKQDFIYSSGLTDYLNPKLTRALISKLFEHLKPGGSVLIGNINDAENGMFWATECILDWTMYFRSQKDMEEIAEGLPGDAELTLDPSGSFFMLKITKPL